MAEVMIKALQFESRASVLWLLKGKTLVRNDSLFTLFWLHKDIVNNIAVHVGQTVMAALIFES